MSNDAGNEASVVMRSDCVGELATGHPVRVIVERVRPAWFDVQFVDDAGIGIPDVEFKVLFPDTTTGTYVADSEGYHRADAPEGEVRIQLADGSIIEAWGDDRNMEPAQEDRENGQEDLFQYVIRSGDTLSKIASRFGTGWRRLYSTSGPDGVKNSDRLLSGDPNLIWPGEVLWVPTRRRVVRIHTDNAAISVTRIRVRGRGRPRTEEQKRSARIQQVYARGLEHLCVDNLAVAVGWDEDASVPDIKVLCREIAYELSLFGERFSTQWCLFLIQGARMQHYDRTGELQGVFDLSAAPLGRVGAYSVVEVDGRTPTRALFDFGQGLGVHNENQPIAWPDLIADQDRRQQYLDTHVEITPKAIHFKSLPVYFQAPSTAGEWANIIWRAGRGVLDDYLGRRDLDAIRHERNLNVLRQYNAVYRGQLSSYIAKLKKITPEQGEDAIRELGEPPEPYRFPLPSGCTDTHRRELSRERAKISSYDAWREISNKIFEIQDQRWASTAARHQEGSIFFRVKFTLEPSVQEVINDFTDTHLFGHLSSYSTVKLEWNFDVGSDGFKSGHTRSYTFKESGKLNLPKFSIGAGQEVEIDESGGEKITVSGTFQGYGMSVASDGEMKMTGPHGVTSSWNERTAEGGMGMTIPIPGIGSIYLGLQFVLIRQETLLMYISRGPGFFERRSCDRLLRTYWKDLTFLETAKLERLGWTQDIWDVKHLLLPAEWPATTRMEIGAMEPEQRIAAMHLGFTGLYRDNWLNYWRDMKPVEEAAE